MLLAQIIVCQTYTYYADEERNKEATTEEISVVRIEDSRQINGSIIHYNLDTILSVMEATQYPKIERVESTEIGKVD